MGADEPRNTSVFVAGAPTHTFTTRLLFGLVLVTLGALWTLDNLGYLDASMVTRWWGAIPAVWGLMHLLGVGTPRRMVPGVIFLGLGVVALLRAGHLTSLSIFDLWPLILIVIGARIVARQASGRPVDMGQVQESVGQDTISTFGIWAGNEYKVVSQAFRGGDVSAMMAGTVVDLRSARLEGGQARIEVFVMWAGIEIIVPRGWRVQSEVTPVLAGFEDSTVHPTDPAAPVLIVRGFALMGGVEVKHRKERDDGEPSVRRESGSPADTPGRARD